MATSKVYAYGSTGKSLYVSERVPTNRRPEKITGEEAQKIHDSADFICVSSLGGCDPKWILHGKYGGVPSIPHRQTGDYEYLAAECEKIAGKGELTILFC